MNKEHDITDPLHTDLWPFVKWIKGKYVGHKTMLHIYTLLNKIKSKQYNL